MKSHHQTALWCCKQCTNRYKLHISHCTLRTAHFTTEHCTLKTALSTMHSQYCTLNTALSKLHSQHCTLNTALSTLHTSQGKPSALWPQKKGSPRKLFFAAIYYLLLCSTDQFDVQCAVYIIQCSIGSLCSAVLGVQCEVLCNGVDSQFCGAQ